MTQRASKSGNKAGSRTLGGKAFAAISAVEGLKLSAAGKKRMTDMKAKGLSLDQQRAEIIRAYSPNKDRR
jgi:hypothetical protein